MRRSTKGFYTVEAAIILPILILTLLAIGYFIKVEGTWENVIHGAVDETQHSALKAYDNISDKGVTFKVLKRIKRDNPDLSFVHVVWDPIGSTGNGISAYKVKAGISLKMPIGFSSDFKFDGTIKYREFIGKSHTDGGMGRTALETASGQYPVIIFPQSGEKYHSEDCTYVKATVEKKILTGEIKRQYSACGLCHSNKLEAGTVIYCFKNEGTAYHRASCKSVDRHTVTVDCNEAIDKGYTPCSKCGGG